MLETPARDIPADLPRARGAVGRRASLLWWSGSAVASLSVVGLHIAMVPRFLFWDDTQSGAFGQWYHLGRMLLDGTWTILDPRAWQAGNYLAEGQWGLLNPIWMLFGLFAVALPNAVVTVTLAKTLLIVLMTGGVFVLARSFGASPRWAALAAAAAPVAGFSLYFDAPTWVTGLACTALLPWAWWALRRSVLQGALPIVFLVFSYLLIVTGYVHGTIALVFVFLAELIAAAVGRRGIGRVLTAGAIAALLTVFVYLPGLLTSPVTDRSNTGIDNDLFLGVDLSDLATSAVSAGMPTVSGFWGPLSPVPVQYIAWFLPLFVLLRAPIREVLRGQVAVLVFGVLSLALVIGPSVIGPLRWPVRFMPYLVIAVLVVLAVAASRALPERIPRSRLLALAVVIAAGLWFAWSQNPGAGAWALVAVLIQSVCFTAFVALHGSSRWDRRRRERFTGVLMIAGVLFAGIPQAFAAPTAAVPNYSVPSSVSELERVGEGLTGEVMMIGNVFDLTVDPDAYDESLFANLWYVAGQVSPSTYTVMPFTEYRERLCAGQRGETCGQAFESLFSTVNGTDGTLLVDVMGVNTLIVMQTAFDSAPETPAGWTMQPGDYTWRYVRDEPAPSAGGLAFAPAGTSVDNIEVSSTEFSFTVSSVDSDDPEIVLSRLDYPGYVVSGAALGEAREGFLLTVDLSEVQPGDHVTVEFRPPGWTLELAAAVAAIALAIAWTVVIVWRRRTYAEG